MAHSVFSFLFSPLLKIIPTQNKQHSSLIKKVMGVGFTTLASRMTGLVREILMGNFLGQGLAADLFFTAYKLPNSLRKIFAEGALSAALVPTCVQAAKNDATQINKLISLSIIVFQGLLLGICVLIFYQAAWVIKLIAPGWFITPESNFVSSSIPILGPIFTWIAPAWYSTDPFPEHILPAVTYVRIVIGFILCLSTSALLAAALQTVNHFFIPAVSPAILNIIYSGGLTICLWFGLPLSTFCFLILFGGIVQALLHLIAYFYQGFSFEKADANTWKLFKKVIRKFIPCLLSMSIMEINLFVSTSLATYLPSGSIASIYYANRFIGIPLGVFAAALSTILLPYFSKISLYAPKRLGFYLFESAKLIAWVTIPLALIMAFFSDKIFVTLFLSKKFTLAHAHNAAGLLSLFAFGLFFFSLNKIILNIYYALHATSFITFIFMILTVLHYVVSRFLLTHWGASGLVMAFVIVAVAQSLLLTFFLSKKYGVQLYGLQFFNFLTRSLTQCLLLTSVFLVLYGLITTALHYIAPLHVNFFNNSYGLWLWAIPLTVWMFFLLITTRRFFGIRLAFLD